MNDGTAGPQAENVGIRLLGRSENSEFPIGLEAATFQRHPSVGSASWLLVGGLVDLASAH